MTKVGADATSEVDPVVGLETGSVPEANETTAAPAEWASEEALFASVDEARCDACGERLDPVDPDGLAGGRSAADGLAGGRSAADYGVAGSGMYLWARGGEVRIEAAPLCPSCASAIGMTALARWEIEEEEG
jgi:hypothetical protein